MESHHNHNETEEEGSNEGIVVAKVVSMIVLGLASSVLGMLPWILAQWLSWNRQDGSLNRSGKSRLILSLLLCFGGGALLCTTFMHMLPEVREAIEVLQSEEKIVSTTFHLPELIMCCGFFTMYLIEEVVHMYLHWREGNRGVTVQDQAIHRSFSLRKCPGQKNSLRDTTTQGNENSGLSTHENYPSTVSITTLDDGDKSATNDTNNIVTKVEVVPHLGHSHMHLPNRDEDPVVTSVRGLLIVLALSIHELFEGLAVGLQTTTGYVWYMLSAVSAHKLVISFCVGIELVNSRTKLKLMVIYILTFALVSPIGIGVGLIISDESGESVQGGAPNAVLQGMATGTLLYVVFFEVLQKERANKESGVKQLLAIMVGFFVMFGLLVSVGHHDHGHGHDDEHEHEHEHLTTTHSHEHVH